MCGFIYIYIHTSIYLLYQYLCLYLGPDLHLDLCLYPYLYIYYRLLHGKDTGSPFLEIATGSLYWTSLFTMADNQAQFSASPCEVAHSQTKHLGEGISKPHGISGKSGPLVPRCFEQLHLGQARDHIRHVPVENKHSPTFSHPCHQSWLDDASYPSLRNSPLTTTFLLAFNQDLLFLGLLLRIRICTLQPYFGLPLPSAGASSGRHVCVFSPLSMSCHACSATAAPWSINSWCWLLVRRGRLGCFPPQYQRRTPVERLS